MEYKEEDVYKCIDEVNKCLDHLDDVLIRSLLSFEKYTPIKTRIDSLRALLALVNHSDFIQCSVLGDS